MKRCVTIVLISLGLARLLLRFLLYVLAFSIRITAVCPSVWLWGTLNEM